MTVAEVGNIVEFYDGLRGRVEKINDNSVIVDLTIMDNFNELDLPEKTVINHKRYKIVDRRLIKMKNVSKALIWFVISFIIFHAILFVMWENIKNTGIYILALC